jgi:hypothetical protein
MTACDIVRYENSSVRCFGLCGGERYRRILTNMTISSIRLRNSSGNLISGSEKRFMTALRVPGEISPSTLFKMSAPTLEVMIITQFLRYSTWSQRGFHRKDKKSRLRPNDSPEIHEPSLPVSQATLIQHLKEQGQEFGTCLFDSRNIIKREEGRERGLSGYRSVDDKTAPEGLNSSRRTIQNGVRLTYSVSCPP